MLPAFARNHDGETPLELNTQTATQDIQSMADFTACHNYGSAMSGRESAAAQVCDWTDIHVFLWRNHKNMNSVFRLVNAVYDMSTSCSR